MSRLEVFCTVAALLFAGYVAGAQTPVTYVFDDLNKVSSDGQPTRLSDMENLTFSHPGFTSITDLKVTLTIANAYNGDFYAHLVQEGNDGRYIDPEFMVDTDSQPSLLSSLNGANPNGTWTLFLADLDFGEQGTPVNWGLVITAVPEPSALTLLGLGGIALGMRLLRRRTAR
jgi:subtilisin-like proprotein convertase family protein